MTILRRKKGQGMIEYTIILAAVVALVYLLVKAFNKPMQTNIQSLGTQLSNNPTGG